MTYQSIHDYYEANPLPAVEDYSDYSDEDAYTYRLDDACLAIDDAYDAEIEYFDCHDLMADVADHYDVERSDLLDYYDSKF